MSREGPLRLRITGYHSKNFAIGDLISESSTGPGTAVDAIRVFDPNQGSNGGRERSSSSSSDPAADVTTTVPARPAGIHETGVGDFEGNFEKRHNPPEIFSISSRVTVLFSGKSSILILAMGDSSFCDYFDQIKPKLNANVKHNYLEKRNLKMALIIPRNSECSISVNDGTNWLKRFALTMIYDIVTRSIRFCCFPEFVLALCLLIQTWLDTHQHFPGLFMLLIYSNPTGFEKFDK